MAINITNDIIIIDEAHNIEDVCRDVASAEFRADHLGMAIDDCKQVAKSYRLGEGSKTSYDRIVEYLEKLALMMKNVVFDTEVVGLCLFKIKVRATFMKRYFSIGTLQ